MGLALGRDLHYFLDFPLSTYIFIDIQGSYEASHG
jgi:hypothetical protein